MTVKIGIGVGNSFRRGLGFALMKLGLGIANLPGNLDWALMSAINDAEFSIEQEIDKKTQVMTANNLENLVSTQMKSNSWIWDAKIRYVDLNTWKSIVREDLIDRLKWISEYFDCDNFSTLFSAYIATFCGLNSAGVALGAVIDRNSKKVIGYHAYNILVTDDGLYCYEPQNDTLAKASHETDMGWALYRTDLVIFR